METTAPMRDSCTNDISHTWLKRITRAKYKHRPKLKNWSKDGFTDRRLADFENLKNLTQNSNDESKDIVRLSAKYLTVNNFIERYEAKEIPCIISDIPTAENWSACNNWTFKTLHPYKDRYFKVGEDDDGYSVKVRLKYFLKYLKSNTDDSPLYIFDSHFDDDKISKSLLSDYSVPTYFPDDLFSLVGESRRPPYRWFLVGPARSGTMLHIDPLGTSAWNTVLMGRKRWVLFPPHLSKHIVKGKEVILPGEDDEAINYFIDLIPRMKQKYGVDYLGIKEFIQYPGDTVFVPGGWWHAVLNLDHTIAVTQNYCSRTNFPKVWKKTRSGRKKMAVKWLQKLKENYPLLAEKAEYLNEVDKFIMYSSENNTKKRKSKKRKKEAESNDNNPMKKQTNSVDK